jgi:amino-acid N-acetyltransferase
MPVNVERAAADDGVAILRLLTKSDLPVAGVLEHIGTALVARLDGQIVGCAALEVYPDGALLRSVAVDSAAKGGGIGTALTTSALDLARTLNMPAVYLLTTTAEGFFPRFGFARIAREEVLPSVQASIEFRSACPASAIVMRRILSAEAEAVRGAPIVCTLQPGELNASAAQLLPGLAALAKARVPIPHGYRFEFAPTSDALNFIAKTVDAERQCCRFLRFQLIVEPEGGPVLLDVSGPPGSEEFLAALIQDA